MNELDLPAPKHSLATQGGPSDFESELTAVVLEHGRSPSHPLSGASVSDHTMLSTEIGNSDDPESRLDELSMHDLQALTALNLIEEARGLFERLSLANDSELLGLEPFDGLAEYVHELLAQHALNIERRAAGDELSVGEDRFFGVIKEAYRILDEVLRVLRNSETTSASDSSGVTLALGSFRESVFALRNANALRDTSAFENASLELIEPAPSWTQNGLDSNNESKPEPCYLEATVSQLSLWSPIEHGCNLNELAAWVSNAAMYRPPAAFLARFGAVQRAHLFRSRKAPFHHEYVIVLLRNAVGGESWVRFERAARRKLKGAFAADSAGPLFGGVKLREKVSFARTMQDLVNDSDELAQVALSSAVEPMSLDDLCQHIAGLSQTKPLYKLFSANCRWLARRALLTIAQWGSSATDAHHLMKWRTRIVRLPELSAKLKREKFGGKDIEGLGGIQLQAYSLAQLAGKYSSATDDDFNAAQDAYHRSLVYLEALVSGIARDNGIHYVRLLDGPLEASLDAALSYDFRRLVDAVPLASVFRSTLPQYFDPYASFLFDTGQGDQVLLVAGLSVSISREALDSDPSLSKEPLGRRLIELGYYTAQFSPDLAEQSGFQVANEAVKIWRELYEEDPARYRVQYTNVLAGRFDDAVTFNGMVDTEEIYGIQREVLKLTRETYASDSDRAYQASDLLNRLRVCELTASNLGHTQDALVFSFEALALAREYFTKSQSPSAAQSTDTTTDWRVEMITEMVLNARYQEAAGHVLSARTVARELESQIDQLSYLRTGLGVSVAEAFHDAALLLSKSDDHRDLLAAEKLIREAERARRHLVHAVNTQQYSFRPDLAQSSLDQTLAVKAKILSQLGLERTREAAEVDAERAQNSRGDDMHPSPHRQRGAD